METSTWILPDTCAQFAQIIDALKLESGSPDSELARGFWSTLSAAIAPAGTEHTLHRAVRLEEALVWRILAQRMLRELGAERVFQLRDKGAASGTCTAHPGIDTLAKTYERLRRIMDELTPRADSTQPSTATGLPMRMMKVLEETEGALEAALGLGPGERSAFSPRLHRRERAADPDTARS